MHECSPRVSLKPRSICDLSFRKIPHIGNDSDAQRNAFSGEARRRETGDQSCAIAVPTPKVGASLTSPLDNG
jgi:hypothetical protein